MFKIQTQKQGKRERRRTGEGSSRPAARPVGFVLSKIAEWILGPGELKSGVYLFEKKKASVWETEGFRAGCPDVHRVRQAGAGKMGTREATRWDRAAASSASLLGESRLNQGQTGRPGRQERPCTGPGQGLPRGPGLHSLSDTQGRALWHPGITLSLQSEFLLVHICGRH